MSEQTQIVQNHVVEEVNSELTTLLRRVPILSSLKDDELHCLEGVREIHIDKGDILTRQGELAHFYWILLEGELRVFAKTADQHEMTLAKIDAGMAFGELALLTNVPNSGSVEATGPSHLLELDEEQFWNLMTSCPQVRKAILGNMAYRFQKLQSTTVQQEKMASLGTLAAGLMHELNNPGAAARRAASQLRENLLQMHELSQKFKERELTTEQKNCMFDLQKQALATKQPLMMNSLDQSDAEEALAEWMESANIENAWKMAPTLVSIGMNAAELERVRNDFDGPLLGQALSWLDALVSSMQLVATIEESIGRVTDLVQAVKSYAYEGKGQRQTIDINNSIHATLIILGHKLREKEIVLEKSFAADLPPLHSECTGLNQIWTNLLDNAIDAVPQHGRISVHTWAEQSTADPKNPHTDLCISVSDNGSGIPLESQEHIFDPFYTTKPVGVGTGIGLGIVQRIVEQYNGVIRFSSEPGNTKFVVRLPTDSE
ncbi:ATP-binding protein [Tunturiibacter lichenicola]|uniref:ATP-binding protein n=1 Tax=Tunturiibacter lichenicola TaxID=2051959 RepID=UPI0021B1C120|nr:ATP-binding protein [Edaphobacter lichenicola]